MTEETPSTSETDDAPPETTVAPDETIGAADETAGGEIEPPTDLPPPAVTGPDPDPPPPPDEPNEPEPEPEPAETADNPDQVTVTVTKFPLSSGVTLLVNGAEYQFPLGKPVTVPRWVLPSLEAVGGLEFKKE